ncbi:MAG: hypothetical protein RE471_02535 [Ferroplasma sp.]|uniref:hypothetical protein n=1 Tax=Ferroplasma sp. TaxID=2591003 RepID=UPI0028168680|nr:hypothetical protein [Ferroplasma sp.]WMT51769.1 MAG: hypothetical protein RE471_02535 [Ferroplasma sp.]
MIKINKKSILILTAIFVAAIMIGIPVSAAATPSTPSYLAAGSSMNYMFTTSGYTYCQSYSVINGMTATTTDNTTTTPTTSYYNVTISASNSTAVNITVPTSTGTTAFTDMPINNAKYAVPVYVGNTSKNVTMYLNGENGVYSFTPRPYTVNYTKAVGMPYYKAPFGAVKAVEFVIDEHIITTKATSKTAASYCNITGSIYANPSTDLILAYSINDYSFSVSSGTTSANETYTAASSTFTGTLADTNAVPIHTDYAGAYVGIAIAAVILAGVLYYYYIRKPSKPTAVKHENSNQKDENK